MKDLQIQLFNRSVQIHFQGQTVDLRNVAGDQRKTAVDYAKLLGLLIWKEITKTDALSGSESALQFPHLDDYDIKLLLELEESTFDKQRKKLLEKLGRVTGDRFNSIAQVMRVAEIDLVRFQEGLRSGSLREMECALLLYEDTTFGNYSFSNTDRVKQLRRYLDKRFGLGLFALQKAGYSFLPTIVQQKKAHIEASHYLQEQFRQRELLEYARQIIPLESLAVARFVTLIPTDFPPSSDLIGRDQEMGIVQAALASFRLVTLLGVGGVGKTSVAVTATRRIIADQEDDQENASGNYRFADGLRFLSLAQIAPNLGSEEEFAEALLAQINLSKPQGSSLHALIQYLQSRRMIIVLDNCEHVLAQSASLVMQILSRCPHLSVLATSRIALNLPAEHTITITPFIIPNLDEVHDLKTAHQFPALIQFEHCRREKYDFSMTLETLPLVRQICHYTSGIPLFIRLAARRPEKLEGIADSISHFFEIAGEENINPNYRHETAWDCIAWSYGLLSNGAKMLLRRLSLLGGEWEHSFCWSICSEGLTVDFEQALAELCNCCLVEPSGQKDFYRTLEPIRAFAERQLHVRQEIDEIITRLDHHLQQTYPVEDLMRVGGYTPSDTGQLQSTIAIAEVLWENQTTDPVLNLRIQIKASGARFLQGIINGTARCLPPMSALVDKAISLQERTDVHLVNAVFTFMAGHYEKTLRHAEIGLSAAENADDTKRVALARCGLGITQAFLRMPEAQSNVEQGKKTAYLSQDPWAIALAHMSMGAFYWQSGHLMAAKENYELALRDFYAIEDNVMIFLALNSLAHIVCRVEGPQPAARLYLDSISFSRTNVRGIAGCILGASGVAFQLKDYPVAALLHGSGLKQYERIGASLIPPIENDYAREITAVKELLGRSQYALHYSKGERLSLTAAKSFAENYYRQICAQINSAD